MENVAGVKEKSKRKESVWKAVWIGVQASLCEAAIRRVTGFTVE